MVLIHTYIHTYIHKIENNVKSPWLRSSPPQDEAFPTSLKEAGGESSETRKLTDTGSAGREVRYSNKKGRSSSAGKQRSGSRSKRDQPQVCMYVCMIYAVHLCAMVFVSPYLCTLFVYLSGSGESV